MELLAYVVCKFAHRDNSSKADTINIERLEDIFNYDPLNDHELKELLVNLEKMQINYNYGLKFEHNDYKR